MYSTNIINGNNLVITRFVKGWFLVPIARLICCFKGIEIPKEESEKE